MKEHVVILGSDANDLAYLYHTLRDVADIIGVVIEKPISRSRVFTRRIKRFGFWNAFGQVLFVLCALPAIRILSRRRLFEIEQQYHLTEEAIPKEKLTLVSSVNSDAAIETVKKLQPSFVLVYGTRLISKRMRAELNVPFINIHAGITPEYRGGQGAYWALREGRPERAGVTVHRIDDGIDTGAVLAQKVIVPTRRDTFVTYPLLQLVAGAQLVRELVTKGQAAWSSVADASAHGAPYPLYAHPTLSGYLLNLFRAR